MSILKSCFLFYKQLLARNTVINKEKTSRNVHEKVGNNHRQSHEQLQPSEKIYIGHYNKEKEKYN